MNQRFEGGETFVGRRMTEERRVASRGDRQHGRLGVRRGRADRLHSQIVADHDAVESQLFLENAIDDERRKRGDAIGIELRREHVRGHDRCDLRRDRSPERHELDVIQPAPIVLDDGQLIVRIGTRIAVAGEMLAARREPGALHGGDDHRTQPGDHVRFASQRAIADDGIRGVGVDIEHRRVVERDPDGEQLGGQCRRKAPGQAVVAAATEHHRWRPFRERRTQARDATTLLIDADPDRPVARQAADLT